MSSRLEEISDLEHWQHLHHFDTSTETESEEDRAAATTEDTGGH